MILDTLVAATVNTEISNNLQINKRANILSKDFLRN